MLAASSGTGGIVVLIVVIIAVLLVLLFLRKTIKVVQQGTRGVVLRLGKYHSLRNPGLTLVTPFLEKMIRVDIREYPHTGDHQMVITQDNVSVQVNATIFVQVVDVKMALFEVANYSVAIDQLARTALRAVFGELTLDQALSQRETINGKLQEHMQDATDKWGVRLNRMEIVDVTPPNNILAAMSEQKEAEQQKRAFILRSEGERQAAINSAEGEQQSAVLRAEGQKKATILAAEAEKESAELRGKGEAARLDAINSVDLKEKTLNLLRIKAMEGIAGGNGSRVVIPYESAGVMGATSMVMEGVQAAENGKAPTPN